MRWMVGKNFWREQLKLISLSNARRAATVALIAPRARDLHKMTNRSTQCIIAVSTLLGHPLDTIKVHLKTNPNLSNK